MTATALQDELTERLDAALPQTQCTRCGYPDCHGYAIAIARGEAEIDRCPPGGSDGIARLAAIVGRTVRPLDPACGAEGPRQLAAIDETDCIGCALCLKVCPVDCIVGAPKLMHTVIDALCTGCELCIPACPVDCITLRPVTGDLTGWQAWSPAQADQARERYTFHAARRTRQEAEDGDRLASRARARLADAAAKAP